MSLLPKHDVYDFAVIGGGSGGLAAAKRAASNGAERVILFDFVKPTVPHGTRWGLGGTCVNVGCIPKKLMHYAARMGPILKHDSKDFGWQSTSDSQHDWTTMVSTIQRYIKMLNFSYRTGLRSKGVEYINALAKFEDPNTLSFYVKNERHVIKAKKILIAVGGRPFVPEPDHVPGAREFAITSDDLFSWPKSPGKTLIVGGSYIALECAGFLTELGYPTTVAVRSILLRGFDRQCSEKIGVLMKQAGTRFLYGQIPEKIEKTDSGELKVTFMSTKGAGVPDQAEPTADAELGNGAGLGVTNVELFDTVMYAAGRLADTRLLGLEKAGIEVTSLGKLKAAENDETTTPNVYVVGDARDKGLELTPVCIKAGELLADRLFSNSEELMSYEEVPTTVFTPMEYGKVGLSEEEAEKKFGKDNLEVYLYEFPSLELAAVHRQTHDGSGDYGPNCLTKLICLKNENLKVVGIHCISPYAGETTQGYALALRLGPTKADFDKTVGIHPTDAESFHGLSITRRSGESWIASGGCGGGKCG